MELELIQHYGFEATIKFSEMASFMYGIMCEEYVKNNPHEPCEFEYEQQWWAKKHDDLLSRMIRQRDAT